MAGYGIPFTLFAFSLFRPALCAGRRDFFDRNQTLCLPFIIPLTLSLSLQGRGDVLTNLYALS